MQHAANCRFFSVGTALPAGLAQASQRQQACGVSAAASHRLHTVATGPDVPPEWQPPRPNTSPSPAPPEFEPPREPGAIPGSVPEYTPPVPPSTPGPTPGTSPGRPLRPDEQPRVPNPDEENPIKNPDKRREQTDNPDGIPEQPANPPGRPLRPIDLLRSVGLRHSLACHTSCYAGQVVFYDCRSHLKPFPWSIPQARAALRLPSDPALLREAAVGEWNAAYGRQGGRVSFLSGDSTRSTAVQLRLDGGTQATVSLVGANVVSWVGSQWRELLHRGLRRDELGEQSLQGGIQVAFPRCTSKQTMDEKGQDAFPDMPEAGFLSLCCFRPVHSAARSGWTSVSLMAQSDEVTMSIWPHAFEALVTISLRDSPEEGLEPGCALRYVLQIYNPDTDDIEFNAEIKPHVKIDSVRRTYLWGFEGCQVITHARGGQAHTAAATRGFPLTEDTVDMLCFNMQRKAIQVECGEQSVAVQARPGQGLRDMGIHHPINTRGHPVSFARDFVMLTGTTAQDPVRLQVAHKWAGELELRETMRIYEAEDGQTGGYDFTEPAWKQPTVRSQAADGAKSSAMEEEGDDERRAFAESFYNPDTSDDYVGTTTEDSSGGGEDNAIDRLAGED